MYVGKDEGVVPFIGSSTKVTNLDGHFLMPGLVDGHMHPLEAGLKLQKCSLDYQSLTVAELQQRVQACLDKTKNQEPDGWLEVVNWVFRAPVQAEEYGIDQHNVAQFLESADPSIRRFLGVDPGATDGLGLDPKWVYDVIAKAGRPTRIAGMALRAARAR